MTAPAYSGLIILFRFAYYLLVIMHMCIAFYMAYTWTRFSWDTIIYKGPHQQNIMETSKGC